MVEFATETNAERNVEVIKTACPTRNALKAFADQFVTPIVNAILDLFAKTDNAKQDVEVTTLVQIIRLVSITNVQIHA